jgi:hypothetical protein
LINKPYIAYKLKFFLEKYYGEKMKKIAITMTLTFLILSTSLSILIQPENIRASNNKILKKMRPVNKLSSLFNFLDNMKPGDIIIHLPGK